jgi:hypothetical protein
MGCDRKTRKDFLRLPYLIYRDDPHWVPPLEREVRRTLSTRRNPYFATASLRLFVCYLGNAVAARTAIVISRQYEHRFGVRAAFFGFFESVDDPEAVHTLFHAVEEYCTQHGVQVVEGPFNPHHYSELGLQVSGFDRPPTFFQPYNPSYYRSLLEGIGFSVSATLHTSRNPTVKEYIQHRYGLPGEMEVPEGYSLRHADMRRPDVELEVLRTVFNDAFSANWHYVPLNREEYRFASTFLRLITEPELITVIEHHGSPVGILMCVLDINPLLRELNGSVGPIKYLRFINERKKIKNLIVYAVGIRSSHHRTPVFKLLFEQMLRTAIQFETLETTWMSPSNRVIVKASERLGMKPDKQFAIYEKSLENPDKTVTER